MQDMIIQQIRGGVTKTRLHHSERPMPPMAKSWGCEGEGGEGDGEEKVSMLTHATTRGMGKNRKNWDCVPIWDHPPTLGLPEAEIVFGLQKNHTLNIFGKQIYSPNTTHTPPPGTGTVACISLDIRFLCIKLSQIFTVSHVLRYEEAKFVIYKKRKF